MGKVHIHRTYYPGVRDGLQGSPARDGGAGGTTLVRRFFPSRTRVPRTEKPYAEERGWKRRNGTFRGRYRTACGSWEGSATPSWGGHLEFSIHNPPRELEEHSHWVCFRHRGEGRYAVHFSTEPENLSAGILEIERILTEAFAHKKKTAKTATVVTPTSMPATAPVLSGSPEYLFTRGEFHYELPKKFEWPKFVASPPPREDPDWLALLRLEQESRAKPKDDPFNYMRKRLFGSD